MNQDRRDLQTEQAAEAAAVWFVRLQRAEAGDDDWRAFETWLASGPANAEAYTRLERIWVELDVDAEAIAAGLEAGPPPPTAHARRSSPRRPPEPARRRMLIGGAIAAGVVGAVAAGVALWPEAPKTAVYATRAGETRRVILPDGTKVQLAAASRIQVRFAHDERHVEMSDAEAVFDVAHDPRRPFVIHVGDREVKVVGTEFNLRRRDGRTVLTVRRGVVEVRPSDSPETSPARVVAGQQLVHRDGKPVSKVSEVAPDAAFAWTTGQLVYRNAPLSQVAGDLSRQLAVPIRIDDPSTANLRITGVLVVDREVDVLRRLEAYAPVIAERHADGVVLRSRGQAR